MITVRYFLLLLLAVTSQVNALCLDPKSGVSVYTIPLAKELQSTKFVLIAKVVGVQNIHGDINDPIGVTEHIYNIHIQRWIKGKTPQNLLIRISNDSGRYSMEQGEVHLLFINREANQYLVNSCGNSAPLPEGMTVANQVKAELNKARKRPLF